MSSSNADKKTKDIQNWIILLFSVIALLLLGPPIATLFLIGSHNGGVQSPTRELVATVEKTDGAWGTKYGYHVYIEPSKPHLWFDKVEVASYNDAQRNKVGDKQGLNLSWDRPDALMISFWSARSGHQLGDKFNVGGRTISVSVTPGTER
jgi:hypothetical protein